MRFVPVVVRVLLGGLFLVSGLNKIVPFGPPPELPAAAAAFIGAFVGTGYMLPFLGAVEVVCGALLIAGLYVPLALVMLAPIVINIALFHLILAPALPVVLFVLAAEIYLAWHYRAAFGPLLRPRSAEAS